MLGSFLEQATSILGRRFVVTAWAPTFVVAALAGGVFVGVVGRERVATGWAQLDTPSQIATGLALLLAITAVAYAVEVLPVVQLFEGYLFPTPLKQVLRTHELRRFDKLDARVGRESGDDRPAYWELYTSLPRRREWVLPTRLGNVMRAAETYSTLAYGADAVHWWPRLVPLLEDNERSSLDETLMPMVALLNGAALLVIATILASVFVVTSTDQRRLLIAVYVGGLFLTWLAYRAALSQAADYGNAVRATIDLHRTEVLDKLRIARPANLAEEFEIWGVLQQWLYNFQRPMQVPHGEKAGDKPWQHRPLVYDDPKPPPGGAGSPDAAGSSE